MTRKDSTKTDLPLIVIVGPTASGKTALAVRLAKEFAGEIISADSRAVYKGLDIGTAKPTREEQATVPHWGIDLVDPGQRFTAADFKEYALQKITQIRARGKIPFLVGGTGLYVDSVVYDYSFCGESNDMQSRAELDRSTLEELYIYCHKHNISLPENYKNKRHVINAILRDGHGLQRKESKSDNTKIVGITTEKDILRERISCRADSIFRDETYLEAKIAAGRYGWDNEAMTGNVYPLLKQYFNNELTLDEVKERFIALDWHLAKRQLTWFRSNQEIVWLSLDNAYTYIAQLLVPKNK